ncbi:zinc finger protein VAR3, chloroplastic [Aristolochia californica]|uniref:zinc finger protein VAR3, chloroplastic n=1 Tax=Aristolochia californica TaxID=171875 RepID=UPI0035DA13DC
MGGVSRFLMLLTTPLPLSCCRLSTFRLARRSRLVSLASFPTPQIRRLSSASQSRGGFSMKAADQIHTQTGVREDFVESNGFSPIPEVPLPWLEWTHFIENLRIGGYFDDIGGSNAEGDDFAVLESLPPEFVRAANACLAFARNQRDLLRSLSKRDIEVIVENGSAFLFKNASESTRRLRTFIASNGTDVWGQEAGTVDVMHFLLSHAYNRLVVSDQNNYRNKELVEASIKNLLNELIGLSGATRQLDFAEPASRQLPVGYGQSPRPFGQNIEMKRGDWICSKCTFMNFARNMRCRQCNEDRPKRVLTGGEWECPQCDFFNYGRNAVCIRCDCKRPGETFASPSARSSLGHGLEENTLRQFNGNNSSQSDIERRLAENDEKAARWFSKVSQVDNVSDLSNVADEDFPEIMPLRKGVNKFVVSTRKTPLERRLANAQYLKNLGNDGSSEGSNNVDGIRSNKTSESSISESLDRILGCSSSASEADKEVSGRSNNPRIAGESAPVTERFASLRNSGNPGNPGRNSGHVPFVPLPPDMFAEPQKLQAEDADNAGTSAGPTTVEPSSSGDVFPTRSAATETASKKSEDQADKSERWFKKVQELHDVTDLASAISDEDFPEIMPMRKGENRFVVPKKKDRSLTSPQYKRRLAMEQANNSNFVPFVPFPPDYFTKKDKQPEDRGSVSTPEVSVTPPVSSTPESVLTSSENFRVNESGIHVSKGTPAPYENLKDNNGGSHDWAPAGRSPPNFESQQNNQNNWNMAQSGGSSNEGGLGSGYGRPTGYSRGQSSAVAGSGSSSQHAESGQSSKESWNKGFSGKSLEGSAVKESDPLDMSEEAKAERWFRRVAQIKDISELSQIPDEDFPSIMPMRKGVNRFVVSKRKTPLERRLTSQQYRRNLPIVNSDPGSAPPSDKNSS